MALRGSSAAPSVLAQVRVGRGAEAEEIYESLRQSVDPVERIARLAEKRAGGGEGGDKSGRSESNDRHVALA